jgi:DNA-directed RNA polymerase subunit RPC12/RpoP
MNIEQFQCGHCGHTFAVHSDHLGQDLQCPHCQQFVKATAPLPAAVDAVPAIPEAGLDFGAPAITPDARPALPAPPRRQLATLLLVFLIPYSLAATGVIAWLLWKQAHDPSHPLEWLLDQQPNDGGPKQIKHDLPLSDRQKTSLNEPIKVGDVVELTPLHIMLAPKGDSIEMTLQLRNISSDLRFNPLPRSFLVRTQGYTFLEFGKHKIYGGRLSYHKTQGFWANIRDFLGKDPKPPFEGILDPGEEMVATLSTSPRDEGVVRKLSDYRGPMLWRLEVRRGLVEIGGRAVSATAVVGVAFDSGLLLRDQREFVRHPLSPCPAFYKPYNIAELGY